MTKPTPSALSADWCCTLPEPHMRGEPVIGIPQRGHVH
ncbi:unnamed protein product [Staurois parvus]|uniref:Uncharacterized protein n=1 Tax=Staurois parvus TaxID=386267 RepID=A0ABN9B950_9NEOB|nr:unnamed protein product [Staurois parvus]